MTGAQTIRFENRLRYLAKSLIDPTSARGDRGWCLADLLQGSALPTSINRLTSLAGSFLGVRELRCRTTHIRVRAERAEAIAILVHPKFSVPCAASDRSERMSIDPLVSPIERMSRVRTP